MYDSDGEFDLRRKCGELIGKLADLQGQMAKVPFRDLRELVSKEVLRSQRHNHYFAIVYFKFEGVDTMEEVGAIREALRTSDVVVPGNGDLSGHQGRKQPGTVGVGAVLPETNREGAQHAVNRISKRRGKALLGAGVSVFPDDGVELDALLGGLM